MSHFLSVHETDRVLFHSCRVFRDLQAEMDLLDQEGSL